MNDSNYFEYTLLAGLLIFSDISDFVYFPIPLFAKVSRGGPLMQLTGLERIIND
tara:strand:+ start:2049 stop:2210 length:162 start_codon:yes stop_codon:yes gene_type:complete